ncbi:MAG TPA: cell division protein CrgA [Acidimicrobiales bacterium]|nr:cell division protein CrgA [Acidimicrobiales bacterium]
MAKPPSKQNPKKSVGRYVDAEARGRVTRRRPRGSDHSPHWYGWLVIDLMIFGMLAITLNYLQVLPGSTSSWYLVLGLVSMFAGFYLATRYK